MRQQSGMSFTAFVFVVALLSVAVTMGLRFVPVYIENYTVVSSLHSLQNMQFTPAPSRQQILTVLRKRFEVNDIRRVQMKDIKITTDKARKVQVNVKYDVVIPLVGNISALINFDDSVVVNP